MENNTPSKPGTKHLEISTIEKNQSVNPTLIFLHHGLGSVGLWRDFPQQLSDQTNCPALVFSRIGHGKSDPTNWPRPVSFLEDQGKITLPALISALDVKDMILVGHSEGATISLVYAATVSAGVRGVIAEAPHLFHEPSHTEAISETRKEFQNGPLRGQLARHHGKNVDGCFYGWADTWLQPGFENWSIEHHIPNIQCPVLAIRGENDVHGTPRQLERLTELSSCKLSVEVTPTGHDPHAETPAVVLKLMSNFINSLI